MSGRSGQSRRHEDRIGIDSEVCQYAPLQLEDGFAQRIAVAAVLPNSIFNGRSRHCVFHLDRDHRNAVDAEHEIKLVIVPERVAKLARDADDVGGVSCLQLCVQIVCCLECGYAENSCHST